MAARSRTLIVCADDFGLNEGINDACLHLAKMGRLSAVSCMVGAPAWRGAEGTVAELLKLGMDVGLHLDFTEHAFNTGLRHSLNRLIALAFLRGLDGARVTREIHAQLDAFEATAHCPPGHLDGHQHIHQFPVIREALLAVLAQRYPDRKPWLRSTTATNAAGTPSLKPLIIQQLGCAALGRLAQAAGFRRNGRLHGVYSFGGTQEGYLALLARWLAAAGDGDLLMCHPGGDARDGDAIGPARSRETGVLSSAAFGELLRHQRVTPGTIAAASDELRVPP